RAVDLKQTAAIPIGRPGAFFPYAVQPGSGSKVYVGGWGAQGTQQLFEVDVAAESVTPLPSGEHPTALALSATARRLFVANAGSDSVSVIDLDSRRLVRTLPAAPAGTLLGASPVALALSRDGHRLYVADAGLNAVAVLDPEAVAPLKGLIPTGWYPAALVLSSQGRISVV